MNYDSVRNLRNLFESGEDIEFKDSANTGTVLYIDSNFCWIQCKTTGKEVELNLDYYDMHQFRVINNKEKEE